MRKSNCPYLRAKILSICGPSALQYWEHHGYTQIGKDHSHCTALTCTANDLNVATYVTKHTTQDCACAFQEPDPVTIEQIYAQGSFPLVAIQHFRTRGGLDNVRIQVKAYDAADATPFIAISHALSGGLGNPLRPALPTCQLLQIDTWVQNAYKERFSDTLSSLSHVRASDGSAKTGNTDNATFWFWMDSLCIPSHTTITSKYDLKARRSFKRATSLSIATLVLDEDSVRLRYNADLQEIYMRIVFSSWFNRMWTLQEAVATPMVLFQTASETLELDELICRLQELSSDNCQDMQDAVAGCSDKNRNGLSSHFHLDLASLHDLQELRKYMIDPTYEDARGSIAHRTLLNRALSQRRTSHEEDLDVIWANLLDLIMPLSRQNSANVAL